MKYGVLTLVDYYPAQQSLSERYQQIIAMASCAERLGFDFFWVGEHHGSEFYCSPSPVPLLSAIAANTDTLRLGPGACLLAHHEPIRVAKDYAMLDVISQSRLEMLIGTTFMRGFHTLNQRISEGGPRNQEALELLQRLWSEESVSHQGQFFQASGSECQPKPLQDKVPLYLACGSPDGARFAARAGLNLSVLSVFGSPKAFRPIVDAYREEAPTGGLVRAGRHVFVNEDHETAQQKYAPYFERYCEGLRAELAYRPDPAFGIEQAPLLKGVNPMSKNLYADIPIEQRIREQTLCGSPDTVAAQMQDIVQDMGALDSFWGLFDVGAIPTDQILNSMTLFAQALGLNRANFSGDGSNGGQQKPAGGGEGL